MFTANKPGKKIKEILKTLGDPYEIKIIDMENVIYRNLNGTYDFEVSGLDNQKKSFNATIYVWELKDRIHIVETISDIKSLDDLKSTLESITKKYLNLINLT
ncbi:MULTISPECIES: hypothetical protein [Clostridium]|uniref:DUF4364 family protein n=1 Tax=Clostridium faecium TaxID=2762223 RepID=A0ABR8YRB7_9CLOT|nr:MULTISPECIES: hypothetical protein [Clostridium]MBD8046786.1 hypothetical protein [Clostridium faecium]